MSGMSGMRNPGQGPTPEQRAMRDLRAYLLRGFSDAAWASQLADGAMSHRALRRARYLITEATRGDADRRAYCPACGQIVRPPLTTQADPRADEALAADAWELTPLGWAVANDPDALAALFSAS